MRNRTAAVPLLAVAFVACAPAPPQLPEIDPASAERIVTTLAADQMQGRAAFTSAANRAAAFLATEMESIDLQPFGDSAGYLQEVAVTSAERESVNVVLDGISIADNQIIATASREAVHWTGEDGVEVVAVGPDDNAMRVFDVTWRGESDKLLLLHPNHQETFDNVKRFLRSPARSLPSVEGDKTLVVVLTERLAPSAISVDITPMGTWQDVVASSQQERLANVVGMIPGARADEIVVFSAHYDGIGIVQPVDGDGIANGANDNASGIAAVIELARYYQAIGEPERTLLFVAFTAEESGGYGSRYFSSRIDADRIVAMLNIEMIGKVAAQGSKTIWMTGFERSDLGEILQRAVDGTGYSFVADPYPDQNLFFRSDNAALARFGVPAHTLSTTPIDVDPDYHRVSDEVETLNLSHMTDVIHALALAAKPLVDGEITPTRIDPSHLR